MPRNLILSTATGKVAIRKSVHGGKEYWEVAVWARPEGLSWKSMRRVHVECHETYAEAKYEGHSYYRDMLETTKEWSRKECLK